MQHFTLTKDFHQNDFLKHILLEAFSFLILKPRFG